MRLSWPRDDDKRRAIKGDLPQAMMRVGPETNLFFINTTGRDVELHRRQSPHVEPLPEAEPSLDLWRQPQLTANHIDLVHYCKVERAYLLLIDSCIHLAHYKYPHQFIIPHISRYLRSV